MNDQRDIFSPKECLRDATAHAHLMMHEAMNLVAAKIAVAPEELAVEEVTVCVTLSDGTKHDSIMTLPKNEFKEGAIQ